MGDGRPCCYSRPTMLRLLAFALSLILGLALAATGSARAQAPVGTLADGRSGKIHFESLTPTGHFQLVRHQATQKAVVFGTLKLPEKAAGRVPAMVIAHGSSGITEARELQWADRLNDLGIAAFIVDSFTPRDIKETASDQRQLSTAANVADALFALKLLATHPRLDPNRIGVMGFSKGGQVALYTALEPIRKSVIADATRFAAHVPLYPYCGDWQVAQRVTGAPLLFLLGGRDDYTPAAPCQDYARWFQSKGAEATVIVYPDAYHGFDSNRAPVFVRDLVAGRNCSANYDLDRFTATIRASGENITATMGDYVRGCQSRGATVGGDNEARRRAPADVATFLKRVFKLS